jgi:uracil-DNA glycosylase
LLWGSFAQSKKYLIDENKHIVLETSHPSPFSASR